MSTPRQQRVYEPRRLMGKDAEELRRELQEELDAMSLTLQQLTDFDYLPQAEIPTRYQEGTIRFLMAGASPVGVAGLHQVRNGEWRRLSEVGGPAYADGSWTEPTLLEGSHYGGSFARVAYRRLPSGLVVLKGLLRDPVVGQILFTLPPGYRPAETHIFTVETSAGSTGRVDMQADGDAVFNSGGTGWVSMSNIHFYAEG